MSLSSQLASSITAINLKQAAALRPLTQSERALLERMEAHAGDLLPDMEKAVESIKKAGGLNG